MNNELTQNDIDKMKAEIEHRKLVVRPKCLEAVKEARAQGDLSENFEYYAAKREKNQNESRIRFLERMIKTAVIISAFLFGIMHFNVVQFLYGFLVGMAISAVYVKTSRLWVVMVAHGLTNFVVVLAATLGV